MPLSRGWEVRTDAAAPAPPQTPPPEETAPEGEEPDAPATPAGRAAGVDGPWQSVSVPSVFDARALAPLYPGSVRRYRIDFTGPETPRGFRWRIDFESVRREATVFLNGRRIGRNTDPYTPFDVDARGLRPGRSNRLVVVVDSRKNPDLPEGWWNWGGIVRPVRLEPVGRAHVRDLGTMSQRALPRARAALPRLAAARRRARASRQARDRATARGAAALARAGARSPGRFRLGTAERPSAGTCACPCRFPRPSSGHPSGRASTPPASRCATAAPCSRWCGAPWACARCRSSAATST